MSQTYPEPLFERVRDHLERAAAILHKDEFAAPIRDNINEALDLALECAYRPAFRPPADPANDNNVS